MLSLATERANKETNCNWFFINCVTQSKILRGFPQTGKFTVKDSVSTNIFKDLINQGILSEEKLEVALCKLEVNQHLLKRLKEGLTAPSKNTRQT